MRITEIRHKWVTENQPESKGVLYIFVTRSNKDTERTKAYRNPSNWSIQRYVNLINSDQVIYYSVKYQAYFTSNALEVGV